MNLEQLLQGVIEALNANTAALQAAGGGAATTTGTTTKTTGTGTKTTGKTSTKTADKPAGPTREEMVAALTEVKEKFGAAEAKAIITKVGAEKMAGIEDAKIGTAFTLAKAKLEAADDDTGGDDDGL